MWLTRGLRIGGGLRGAWATSEDVDGGDVIFVPATNIPLEDAADPDLGGGTEVPALPAPPEDEEQNAARMLGIAPPQSQEEAEA